ncbi:uncharacterized protein JCM6883_006762 [Sporobolomyces salmoneus]|uniref:uncharacterized protein n=1 Tax=Sporobolomyces salmoneus TaxID=183962 RepID=UPI0031818DEE
MFARTPLASRIATPARRPNVALSIRSPFFRKFLSTSLPRRSTTASPESSATSPAGPSATAVFYRALVPSMLHCLALGSIVYYALELAYMTLKREQQVELLGDKVRKLEGELEDARRGPIGRVTGMIERKTDEREEKPWWKVW